MSTRSTTFLIAAAALILPSQAFAQEDFSVNWHTIDCGGGQSTLEEYILTATIGQPDAGQMSGPESIETFSITSGYWVEEPSCAANCDGSSGSPLLTGNDFVCFVNLYSSGSPAANCDGSSEAPILTGNDFVCFVNAYAAGCP